MTEAVFLSIRFSNRDLPIPGAPIKAAEVFGTLKTIDSFIYSRQWINLFSDDLVKAAIVKTESEGPIFFLLAPQVTTRGFKGTLK